MALNIDNFASLYDLLYFANCETHSHRMSNHLRQQYHFGMQCTLYTERLLNNTSVNDMFDFIKYAHFYNRI